MDRDILLQLDHTLLIGRRIFRARVKRPAQELVGIIRHEARVQNSQPLPILGHLLPIALHVLQVRAEISVRAFEDLPVDGRRHDGLDVDVFLVGLRRVREDVVGRLFDGFHELGDFVRVLGDEGLVADVQNGAEAAAAELGELVDAEHLHIGFGTALRGEPFFELDHLHVLETDAGVDFAFDDGFADVHAAADGTVVVGRHSVVFGEFVDLDLREG